MLAADYPMLGLFWTMLWLYLLLAWLALVFRVVVNVFRDDTIGGAAKALWLLAVVLFPLVGPMVYVIRHSDEMNWSFGPSGRDQHSGVMAYTERGMRYHDRAIGHY